MTRSYPPPSGRSIAPMADDLEGTDEFGTPYGLLKWGQAGIYNAVDDRTVITALSDSVVGVVRPARLTAGTGLTINVHPGWLAIASADDGTHCVVGSRQTHTVTETGGGNAARVDHVWIDTDPDNGRWYMRLVPQGTTIGRSGVSIGRITVPAGANLASQMTFTSLVPTLGRHADANHIQNGGTSLNRLTPNYPIAPYQIRPARTFVVHAWGDGYMGVQARSVRFRCSYPSSPILYLVTNDWINPRERFDWECTVTMMVNPTVDSFRTHMRAVITRWSDPSTQSGHTWQNRTMAAVRNAWGQPHLGVNPNWTEIQVQGAFTGISSGQMLTCHGSTFETYEPYLD
ncbi:MAG: hypothetical protein FWE35_10805 [Streptosporangiales bacterium]|nr:hypothetical protein [Streptosporangiales bacterium]